jgi:tetratricopeptide (TPR) repeat protein
MSKISYKHFLTMLVVLSTAILVSAQVRPPLPRPSQKSTVMQTVGTTDISITYSRPAVKGRPIFGDAPESMAARAKGEATLDNQNERKAGEPIVPYGHVWRAGANEATLFVFADDVLINGQPLAAGKYSFHAIPAKDGEWTLIFNKDDGQWGSFFYDPAKDALRVKTKAAATSDSSEFLTYAFDNVADNSTNVVLRWEKVTVPFKVEVKDVAGTTMKRLTAYVNDAKPDEWQRALNAAMYAKQNKLNDDAARWFDQSLKAADALIAAKPTFVSYRAKATILRNAGRAQEALAAAEKAVEIGKAEKADAAQIAALEKQIADAKAAKQ